MLCLSGFELYSRWVPLFNLRYSTSIYISSVSLISFPFLENYDLKSYGREMLLLKKRYMEDDLCFINLAF